MDSVPVSKRSAVLVTVAVVFAVAVGLFAVDLGASAPEPVEFSETRSIGFASEVQRAIGNEAAVPRVQVFYSQYQYVVGYYGLQRAVAALTDPTRQQQFGYPIATYVTDYAGTGIELDENGTIQTDRSTAWVPAGEAYYVVDSDARAPSGAIVVPFSDRAAATTFADRHGGQVLDWASLRDRPVSIDDASLVRDRVETQQSNADARLQRAQRLLDRPLADTEDDENGTATIQSRIDAAPNGSTVVLPAGTYEESIEIDRPMTLVGPQTTIDGGGEGDVIAVSADEVAIVGITVRGAGDTTRDPNATAEGDWDTNIELGYGHGDAAIAIVEANGTLVQDVTVAHTDSNGILVRDAPDTVVQNVSVAGAAVWRDSFMGVMLMRSPRTVIENATFLAGRDGVYLHRSPETVIRSSTFTDGRYGVHLMHTSDALIHGNEFVNHEYGGITIMTDPARNAIVNNVVANTSTAIGTSGSDSYIAHNIAVDSRLGISTSAIGSLYEHNVLMGNEYGMRTGSVIATSDIARNDFVDNDRHAGAGAGPLRIWAADGVGNYWTGMYGPSTGGTYERAYSPTDPVQGELHRSTAHRTLHQSPVYVGLRTLKGAAPGLRSGSIIDPYPSVEPLNPQRLETAHAVRVEGIDGTRAHSDTNDTEHEPSD